MLQNIPIEGILAGDEYCCRLVVTSPCAPPLLPQRGACAGPAGDHHGIKTADVDTEFEGIRR